MKEITVKAKSLVGKNVYTDLGCKCEHTCAEFVSIVLTACGYGDVTSVSCNEMKQKMSSSPNWSEPDDWMIEGDIIFFDWDNKVEEKPLEHVGIVLGVDGNKISYINANGNDHYHVTIQTINKYSSSIAYWMRPVKKSELGVDKIVTVEIRQLRKGMKGKDVESMQAILIAKGYSCGIYGSDGDFGSSTENAVRNFQTDRKISVDGIVGKKTWSELFK